MALIKFITMATFSVKHMHASVSSCIKTLFLLATCISGNIVIAQGPVGKLLWSDEFNNAGLPDTLKWNYDVGTGCPELCGWGNNEKQFYSKQRLQNARVENGVLIIEAIKESFNGSDYSSARLTTKSKGDWKYGRFEIRAKLPAGKGIWSAIWMLPSNPGYGGWPHSGEIDIMENVGYLPDTVYGTIHSGDFNGMNGKQKSLGLKINDLSTNFHVYAVDWTPEKISFFVDGRLYNEFVNQHSGPGAWPFDKPFHLILNIAVGGSWGGKHGIDNSVFPQKMEIDYVRVYDQSFQ